jgi:hypothetical protein
MPSVTENAELSTVMRPSTGLSMTSLVVSTRHKRAFFRLLGHGAAPAADLVILPAPLRVRAQGRAIPRPKRPAQKIRS